MKDFIYIWLDVVTLALLIGYVYLDIKGYITFNQSNSKSLWWKALIFGTLAAVVLYYLAKYIGLEV